MSQQPARRNTGNEPAAKRLKAEPTTDEAAPTLFAVPSCGLNEQLDGSTVLLPAMKQLLAAYKVEYWSLLESLRAQQAACRGDVPEGKGRAAQSKKGGSKSLRELLSAQAGREAPKQQCTQTQPEVSSGYGDERCGHGSSQDAPDPPPSLAEVEQLLASLPPGPDAGAADAAQLEAWQARFQESADAIAGLEQLASAASMQFMDTQGGLACLCGQAGRWLIRRTALSLGRATASKGDVDLDLGQGGAGSAASRLQAQLTLGLDGSWTIHNTGRAAISVNGASVARGGAAALPHLSLLEVGGLPLLFMANALAVQRAVARSSHVVL